MSETKQSDDLTPEEIRDIEEFRNNSDNGEIRTLKELLQELNAQWHGTCYKSKFLKRFKGLDLQTKKCANTALNALANSENPSDLGIYKSDMRVFAYDIGKYRMLFSIRYSENTIDLMRVCDHKSVYGKD